MPIKEYFKPDNFEQVQELIMRSPIPVKVSAGCTDLTIQLSQKESPATRLISLKNIPELQGVRESDEGKIFIGAAVSHADIAQSPLLLRLFPALAKASGLVAAPSIRNMGTIGGNICNASPSADTAPPLLAYDAKAIIRHSTGEKIIPVNKMFVGPSVSILKTGEVLKGFVLKPQNGLIADFEKLGIRKAMEIALVNVCIALQVNKSNVCTKIRIALGAVAPTPMRAQKAEAKMTDKKISHALIKETAETAIREIAPITDIRASAGYRTKMVGALIEKILHNLSQVA
jgi:CO/xanthine dehydrogenase FAD-binding subunit